MSQQLTDTSGSGTTDSEKFRQISAVNVSTPKFDYEEEDNSDAIIECNKRTKKRPGLSNGLVPGKKAMKFHEKVYNTKW